MADAPGSLLQEALHGLSPQARSLIERALHLAKSAHTGQTRKNGSPYIEHPIAVAVVLAAWGADAETIAAGLLHDAIEDTSLTKEGIAKEFGDVVAQLVEGVTKITETDLTLRQEVDIEKQLTLDRKTETLRKLFDVMRQDIRALVIKMADRLHNVRTIDELSPERRVRFAKETLDIYYKLAYHLGMNDVRREFSERCVPIVYPKEGPELLAMRAHQLSAAAAIAASVEGKLRALDKRNTIVDVRLEGHSLVSLLHDRKQPDFNEDLAIYVVIATKDEDGCYAALKNLHGLLRPRSALFRDYIATPARSGYRSLHTTVLDEKNDMLDVRIRTRAMDEEERLGLLRYCFSKDGWSGKEFEWLQRSAAFDEATREDSAAFLQALQSDILQENVTVIVEGQEVQVPDNATALDAIYARHGTHAHKAMAVQRNGITGLFGESLEEEDVLDTVFSGHHQVRFEWLTWVTSAYARTLIVEALKTRSREEKLSVGRDLLQKEMDRYRKGYVGDLSRAQQETTAKYFERPAFEDVLAMIGEGSIPPGDVALALWPERRRWRPWPRKSEGPKRFQIYVSGTHLRRQEILPRLASVAERAGTEIESTQIRFHERSGTYGAVVRGRTPGRSPFADFLSALDRTEWTSHVYVMASPAQQIGLAMRFAVAGAIVAIDILLIPFYARTRETGTLIPAIIFEILPLLPIIGVNYYLLKILRQHSVRMRQDKWFLGLASVIHILGLALILGLSARTQAPGVLPLVAVLIGSMVHLTYRFFQTESQFTIVKRSPAPTTTEWRAIKRRKIAGYTFRLFAVAIWGIQPLYLKYTPAAQVSPFVRVFLMSAGIVFISALLFGLTKIRGHLVQKKTLPLKIHWNKELLGVLIGSSLFTYFLNASLMSTTSTNFILFNNFSPVLALLVAAILWRQSIPYLKDPRNLLWIFIIFLIGSAGGSLILYNTTRSPNAGTIIGDIFGVLAMMIDTLYVISQIRYMKIIKNASAFSINIHIFSIIALALLPILIYLYAIGSPIMHIARVSLLWGFGAGILSGIGQILNYETFRRVDGFIAFLMFNVAILITFIIEVYVLGTFIPSWIMLLGGFIIIGSSISAEVLNARCEKKGL